MLSIGTKIDALDDLELYKFEFSRNSRVSQISDATTANELNV